MGAALAIGGIFSFIVVMAIAMEAVFHSEDENPKTLEDEKDGSEKDA